MKLLVTGATGFIGRALADEAKRRGHSVVAVSRDASKGAAWDPMSGPLPAALLERVDAVVHLAGENVGTGRWTKGKMAAIRDSRVIGTRNLVAGLAAKKPKALVCGSAIGFYGSRGDEVLTEQSPGGGDFLAGVCREWEAEAGKARGHGVRVACVRTGVVLGRGGGALAQMLFPFRMNMGGPVAGGKQWMSWVHLNDIVGLLLHAAEKEIEGPMLGTAPLPVTNYDFTKTLGRVMGKWTFLPMPGFMLRVIKGKFAEVIAGSQRCDPVVAKQTGYGFRHPTLEGALRQILS